MSNKRISFQADAAGIFDGDTLFTMPDPLPTPDSDGIYVIPVNATTGPLGRLSQSDPVWQGLVGGGGYLIRSIAVDTSGNAAIERVAISAIQPQPSVAYAANNLLYQDYVIQAGSAAIAQSTEFVRRGPYVPQGWQLVIRLDDNSGGATAITGPSTVTLEVETCLSTRDAARAIKSAFFGKQAVERAYS
jgi:hypothetical protein